MTPPRHIKPVMLVVSAGVLLVAGLWLVPGARGVFGGGEGGTESGGGVVKSEVGDEGGSGEKGARVRERPPEPSKAQRQLRNMLAEKLGVTGSPPRQVDWEKLKEFRAGLDRMETEDLLAVLAELEVSEIKDSDKGSLAIAIAVSLSRRDPELALNHMVSRIPMHPHMMTQLGTIYRRWMFSDPAAASAWFDEQVAKGAIAEVTIGKMKVNPRIGFESELVRAQAALDAAAAATRFEAMPVEMREKIVSEDWFGESSPEQMKAVAEFLREHYEDGPATLAKAARVRIEKGELGDVEKFLDALEPAPEERAALVGEALRVRVNGRDELTVSPEEAREWIVKQSPEDAGRLTGAMLGQMMEWHEFADMSRLALQYREESGSDEVLVAFLKSAPESAKAEILEMAEKIEDPAVRGEVTGRFGK